MRITLIFIITLFFILHSTPYIWASTLTEIDVSGQRGDDGKDGRDGHNSHSTRGSGGDGEDATHATAGEHAGNITLKLESGVEPTDVLLKPKTQLPSSRKITSHPKQSLKIGNSGYIQLKANGGRGGDGANGGDGGRGGKGSRGSDATRYSEAGSGGTGGRGGDGGNGTSGERGGDGGRIVIQTSDQETHFFILTLSEVKKGDGGNKGKNGCGGPGGDGGDGGSGCSWTTTSQESYTDSQGHSRSRTVTHYHSRSSGWDGSTGPSGADGTAHLIDGASGKQGSITYEVHKENGEVLTYTDRYRLVLQSYTWDTTDHDGIFEPDETVAVRGFTVKNTGQMPTPPYVETQIYLATNKWVNPSNERLVIPKSLAPGESYTFPPNNALHFKISDVNITKPGARFEATATIEPQSLLEVANRPYETFRLDQDIPITFPIELKLKSALPALLPGEMSRCIWEVTNLSKKRYGELSNEIPRQLAVKIVSRGGDLPLDQIYFFVDGKMISLSDGFHSIVPKLQNLGPGETTQIEGVFGIDANAKSYLKHNVHLELELGKLSKPTVRRKVQIEEHAVRVSQGFSGKLNTDLLLITNSGTSREAFDAWMQLADKFGLNLDIWDISRLGYWDFLETVHTSNKTMFQHLEGKTIVFLANNFATASDKKSHITEFIAKSEFIKAIEDYDINILFLGTSERNKQDILTPFLIPTAASERSKYSSRKEFLKKLRADNKKRIQKAREIDSKKGSFLVQDQEETESFDRIQINKSTVFSPPKSSDVLDHASVKLQNRLVLHFPEDRYFLRLSPEDNPKKIGKKWLIWKEYNCGDLCTYRTTGASSSKAIAFAMTSKELQSSEFILGPRMEFALFTGMNFPQRLGLLSFVLGYINKLSSSILEPQELDAYLASSQTIINSIISSIALEINSLVQHSWNRGFSGLDIWFRLEKLRALNSFPFPFENLQVDEPSGKAFIDLIAGVQFILDSQSRWYDRWLGFGMRRSPKVAKEGSVQLERLFSKVFSNKSQRQLAQKQIEEKINHHWTKTYSLQKDRPKQWLKDTAMEYALQTFYDTGITTDAFLFNDKKERILNAATFEKLQKSDQRQEQRRLDLANEVAQAKDNLLLDYDSCQALLQSLPLNLQSVYPQSQIGKRTTISE